MGFACLVTRACEIEIAWHLMGFTSVVVCGVISAGWLPVYIGVAGCRIPGHIPALCRDHYPCTRVQNTTHQVDLFWYYSGQEYKTHSIFM